jgi:hypothetical protein
MLKAEIDALRKELDDLIDRGADYGSIYKASVKLDALIARYYASKGVKGRFRK